MTDKPQMYFDKYKQRGKGNEDVEYGCVANTPRHNEMGTRGG